MCGTDGACGPCSEKGGCGSVAKKTVTPFMANMRIQVLKNKKARKSEPGEKVGDSSDFKDAAQRRLAKK